MRKTIVVIAVMLAALPLAAQMNGGGMTGQTGGVHRAIGTSPMPGMFAANMMQLPVAADGTVFVAKKNATTGAYEVAAVRPDGTVAWTYANTDARSGGLVVSGNTLVLTLTGMMAGGGMMGGQTEFDSTVVGLSVASGAELWKVTVDGVAMGITPYADGVYVVAVDMPTAAQQPSIWMSRKLIAISSAGTVKFTLPLD